MLDVSNTAPASFFVGQTTTHERRDTTTSPHSSRHIVARNIPRFALSNGTELCRPPRPEERDALCAWRLAYDIELLGATEFSEHPATLRGVSRRADCRRKCVGRRLWKTCLFRCRLSTPHSRISFNSGVSTRRQRLWNAKIFIQICRS